MLHTFLNITYLTVICKYENVTSLHKKELHKKVYIEKIYK
jgi:hypothetical protein